MRSDSDGARRVSAGGGADSPFPSVILGNPIPISVYAASMRIRPRTLLMLAVPIALMGCGGFSNMYQGMDAPTLYQRASDEYASGDYADAIRTLDRLLVAFGDWDRVLDARMLLGHSYYAKGEYITSRSEYGRFLDRYSGHENAPEAALGVCRSVTALSPDMQRDQTYTAEAITLCRNVVIDYAGTPQALQSAELANQMRFKLAEKELLTGDFYFGRKLFDSAIIYYEFVVTFYAETEFAPRALAGLYYANAAVGYDDIAGEMKDRLLRDYPESEAAAALRTNGSGG